MVEPLVWLAGGAAALFLLKPTEKKKPKTPEEKAEEISQDVVDQVVEVVNQANGTAAPTADHSGVTTILEIVETVNNQVENYTETGDESIGSAEAGELDDDQKVLYEQTAKQRNCIQIYEDKPIDEKTEQVYILLESHKGWKVKYKPIQEGSTIIRKFFCPPGREPLQW